uniref:Uncharacterized protein n=1 Tax=Lactuca sativa TaxID=4236 RepID=A0A9R1XF88_LACSA|nr:hypothetical protein LSAT_V11C400180200 [Lactuca sativa]
MLISTIFVGDDGNRTTAIMMMMYDPSSSPKSVEGLPVNFSFGRVPLMVSNSVCPTSDCFQGRQIHVAHSENITTVEEIHTYVLKQLSCFIELDNPVSMDSSNTSKSCQYWVVSGSISGFDIIISLSKIQMLLSISKIYGFSTKERVVCS